MKMSDTTGPRKLSRAEKIRSEAHDWVVAMEEPPHNDTDRKRFERWLHADVRHVEAYDRAITVRAAVESLGLEDIDRDLRKEFLALKSETRPFVSTRPSSTSKWTVGLGGVFAASLSLVLVLLLTPTDVPPSLTLPVVSSHETSIGEKKALELPDGTSVILDGNTEVSITFNDERRQVKLSSGAAFFDVAQDHERPFSVESGGLSAVALGTRFEVRTTGQGYRIGVEEGEVEVRYPITINGLSTGALSTKSLLHGQTVRATFQDGLGQIEDVDLGNIAAWRDDRFIFRSASLAEFVAELNRHSGVTIALDPADSFSDFEIDGSFVGADVDRLLLALTTMHPVEIDRSDPSIVLIRRL